MQHVSMRRRTSGSRSSKGHLDANIQAVTKSSPLANNTASRNKAVALIPNIATPKSFATFKHTMMGEVKSLLRKGDLCPPDLIDSEVEYFFSSLGLEDSYFRSTDTQTVANHILCIFSAKSISRLSNNPFAIDVKSEDPDRAFYICNSTSHLSEDDQSTPPSLAVERRIESKYLSESLTWEAAQGQPSHHQAPPPVQAPKFSATARRGSLLNSLGFTKKKENTSSAQISVIPEQKSKFAPTPTSRGHAAYRVNCFRTRNHVSDTVKTNLWFFTAEKASFLVPREAVKSKHEGIHDDTTMTRIANDQFRDVAAEETLELYQDLINQASRKLSPVTTFVTENEHVGSYRLVICHRSDSGRGLFSGLSNLVKSTPSLLLTRKEFEPFHGFVVISLSITAESGVSPNWQSQLEDGVSLLFSSFASSSTTFSKNVTPFNSAYNTCAAIYVFYFHAHVSAETLADLDYLQNRLIGESKINKLHTMIRTQELTTWSESRIDGAINNNIEIMHLLAQHFDYLQSPYQHSNQSAAALESDIHKLIHALEDDFEQEVLSACLRFNALVKHTNMYRKSKSALLFEISTDCLKNNRRYPEQPYCILMIIGSDFRGFHVRFSDISRGGVRLIKSKSQVEWQRNAAELFFEDYSLAWTQQRKNKDIPEGGSKGVILTLAKSTDNTSAFKRYIDAILDYLLPDPETQPNRRSDDMVFIGPDENTADLMDWACDFACMRGLRTWKAFTTGKSARLGGIPHDQFGMTTRGVHQYVLGSLAKMGLNEEDVTKCQTGGPDGDLGSNEILISKDKTIAIIDGSGVLYDPIGLNRSELRRLATARLPVKHFTTKLLSPQGFLINSDEKSVQMLPDGTEVEDSLKFRNNFHLHPLFTADVFVPCGGRPAAVNMSNINVFERVKDPNGVASNRFKLIVEGANLFITQDARLVLENNGVVLFKDASANKGGVTSSSCEVLASLALTEDEHSRNMCLERNRRLPEFYEKYAVEVQHKIEFNAIREFECIWKESQRTHKPKCEIGDELSRKINTLAFSIRQSELLWADVTLRNVTLSLAVPKLLIDLVDGCENLVKRVPDSYCRWIFASFLASDYIYSYGIATTEFTFMTFVEEFKAKAKPSFFPK